ncbi:MAG TPA: GGDEF domain-containing protein, partial [Anaerolineales bacterium]|nr:GGDEF domain-containing protein [Anaerolineales bacterium]
IARARRAERLAAVFFIDLDGFKQVNDRLGHDQGDALLVALACSLQAGLRQADTVSRLGGDEFAVLSENLDTPQAAAAIAAKLLGVLAQPYELESGTVQVTGSIGVSFYPRDGADAEDLLQKADAAMYRAKQSGKNRVAFFSL